MASCPSTPAPAHTAPRVRKAPNAPYPTRRSKFWLQLDIMDGILHRVEAKKQADVKSKEEDEWMPVPCAFTHSATGPFKKWCRECVTPEDGF